MSVDKYLRELSPALIGQDAWSLFPVLFPLTQRIYINKLILARVSLR